MKYNNNWQYSLLFILLASYSVSCIRVKETVVEPDKFLGVKKNSPDIYSEKPDGTFISPFNIKMYDKEIGIITKLALVDLKDSPDYKTIEIQQINNRDKNGWIVLLYHTDEKKGTDIYHTNGLKLNKKEYESILNKVTIQSAKIQCEYNYSSNGLEATLELVDKFGKTINMSIKENHPGHELTAMMAPIGGMSKKPDYFPFIYIDEFRMLAQKHSKIKVSVNGELREPDNLPLRINGEKVFLARYANHPVIGYWNVAHKGTLHKIKPQKTDSYKADMCSYILTNNNGHIEINRFTGTNSQDEIIFRFVPPVPDLICLKNGIELTGKFAANAGDKKGVLAGEYEINRSGNTIKMQMHPTKGWSPVPGKAWMKKYIWKGVFTIDNEKNVTLHSEWQTE